ncbi:hypothetical protein QL285_031014 [Trifolium repens]|nr:hypothetical protein QL285_031014 [Trifolium repens]
MEALNDISVLSWNIREAHNNNSKRHLKEVIRKYRPTFLAILETHVPYARLSSFWTNNGYTPIHVIEANGHSGGIWLLKHSIVTINTTVIDSNQYSIAFIVTHGDASSTCTCVDASPNPTLRTNFWNYLIGLSLTITGPWMLIGDFNGTLLPVISEGVSFNITEIPSSLILWTNATSLISQQLEVVLLGTAITMAFTFSLKSMIERFRKYGMAIGFPRGFCRSSLQTPLRPQSPTPPFWRSPYC